MSQQKEHWKCIPGYPKYIASNLGNIMRLPELQSNDDGRVNGFTQGRYGMILSPRPILHGHLQVNILNEDGKQKMEYVHRLVAMAWLKRKKGKEIVCHKDDNPNNNNVNNLMWGTHYINQSMITNRNSALTRGNMQKNADIVKELYKLNKDNYVGGVRKLIHEIANDLGLSYSYVCHLLYNKKTLAKLGNIIKI